MNKKFYLVLDVETANSTEDALVYDIGYAVCDRRGNIYESESFLVKDIFFDEADLMISAYYAQKIPQYLEGIDENLFRVRSFYGARAAILDAIKRWNVSAVCAYNAHFDVTALNKTERWLTKSKYRYFLPYGTEVNCIWHMACQTICKQKAYARFCHENGMESASGNIKTSAEAVYAYMKQNPDFDESHTGLEDVLIEVKIMAHCFRQHKRMDRSINRRCWQIPQAQAKQINAGA